MAENSDLLNLETAITRPTIAIDGKVYEIRSPDELSIMEHARLQRDSAEYNRLVTPEALTDDQVTRLEAVVISLSDFIMVGVPAEVRQNLSGAQRMDVIAVFTMLPLGSKLESATGAIKHLVSKLAGANALQGSNDSMEETPETGFIPSR